LTPKRRKAWKEEEKKKKKEKRGPNQGKPLPPQHLSIYNQIRDQRTKGRRKIDSGGGSKGERTRFKGDYPEIGKAEAGRKTER